MRIGLTRHYDCEHYDSLRCFFKTVDTSLRKMGHDVIHLPNGYYQTESEQQRKLAESFVSKCDVILYGGQTDAIRILEARKEELISHSRMVPVLYFVLGSVSRGAKQFIHTAKYLYTSDILIANCSAEAKITHLFFPEATVKVVPFAVDEQVFFPLQNEERETTRQAIGLGKLDRVLLYSGRITAEKNVHFLLRLFSIVQCVEPNVVLLIAGEAEDASFHEMGVYPKNWNETIKSLCARLLKDCSRVHFIGRVDAQSLRLLYGIADIVVNMTLHHDENFGLAQAEGMACGIPVVGSCWGGLKDTILHGITGFQVSTYITETGVRLDWLAAVNFIIRLLGDKDLARKQGTAARQRAVSLFSNHQLAESLQTALIAANSDDVCVLRPSLFAQEYWLRCRTEAGTAAYHRSARTFQLYRELIRPYIGTPSASVRTADETIILACAVHRADNTWRLDDPLFPVQILVPTNLKKTADKLLDLMIATPAMSEKRLLSLLASEILVEATLEWMVNYGVLLRSGHEDVLIPIKQASASIGVPIFSLSSVVDHGNMTPVKQMIGGKSNMEENRRALLRPTEDTEWTDNADEVVAVYLQDGILYSLKDAAAEIWRSFSEGCSIEEAAQMLVKKYEIPITVAVADVEAFVTSLIEKRLLGTYS